VDFYQLLSLARNASVTQIKSAYHRALLQSHPDKKSNHDPSQAVDIALIKEAYYILSNSQLRAKYDIQLSQRSYSAAPPRPAQVISLEDFEEVDQNESEVEDFWRYACRCGGFYHITTTLMEKGEHLIACNSCSEVVWVGYELVES
ncbi:DnaJ-domain-containing protein, partial [Phlegmacium glaucopus]